MLRGILHQNAVTNNDHSPFFIIGCVRSGTTLLREILNTHANLVCPEETHFYRWGHPFGTGEYMRYLRTNSVLKKHREIDGISEEIFADIMDKAISRRDLFIRYMDAFKAIRKPTAQRWFDKTPQNVYGALMMHSDFPEAKFVHIVRHPYNIVASLRLGKVMSIPELVGACNYWTEAVSIAHQLKSFIPSTFYEIKYEHLVNKPQSEINHLLNFIGERNNMMTYKWKQVHKEQNQHLTILNDEDRSIIDDICRPWIERYSY